MKSANRVLATILALIMIIGTMPVFANAAGSAFSDFPTGSWSEAALTSAVSNGLLQGKGEGTIAPKDYLTRAEAATIINRAFGATVKADISAFTDVSAGEWYYPEIQKAVNMQTIMGVSSNEINPTGYITRESMLTVLARALVLPASGADPLGRFGDGGSVSSWASASVAAMAERGYVNGDDKGNINPQAYITREEFAQVMYNIFKMYISAPAQISDAAYGTTLIRTPDVKLSGVTIDGDLIVGDGVGKGNLDLEGVKVTGRILFRGGEGKVTFVGKSNSVGEYIIVHDVNGIVNFNNYKTESVFKNIILDTEATFLKRATGSGTTYVPQVNYTLIKRLEKLSGGTYDESTSYIPAAKDQVITYVPEQIQGFEFHSVTYSPVSAVNNGSLVVTATYNRIRYSVTLPNGTEHLDFIYGSNPVTGSNDAILTDILDHYVEQNETEAASRGYEIAFEDENNNPVDLTDPAVRDRVDKGEIHVHVVENPIVYTISYNLGTGQGNVSLDLTPPQGETAGYYERYTVESQPSLPTPAPTTWTDANGTEWIFAGWYDNAGFEGTALNGFANKKGNLTLYAKWVDQPVIITVTFGGTPYTIELGGLVKDAKDALQNVLRDILGSYAPPADEAQQKAELGYEFKGNFRINTEDGDPLADDTRAYNAMTIVPDWEPIPYTITLELNGHGTLSDNTIDFTVETETITLPELAKDGDWNFMGWYANAEGTGNKITTVPKGTVGSKIYYAKWVEDSNILNYTLVTKYQKQDGTGYENETSVSVPAIKNQPVSVTPSEVQGFNASVTYEPADAINSGSLVVTVTYDRYVYNVTLRDGTPKTFLYGNDPVNNSDKDLLSEILADYIAANKDEAALRGYDIVLEDANGNALDLTDASVKASVDKGEIHVYIAEAPVTYSISYNLGAGTGNVALDLTPPAGEEAGYYEKYTVESQPSLPEPAPTTWIDQNGQKWIFGGWYDNAECTGDALLNLNGKVGNITLYASWVEPATVNVRFDGITYRVEIGDFAINARDVSNNVLGNVLNAYAWPSDLVEQKQDQGYEPDGFRINTESGTVFDDTIKAYNNMEIVLGWKPIPYTITLELNGHGTLSPNTIDFTVETETITLPELARDGDYLFRGWFVDAEGNGSRITTVPKGTVGPKTYYAKWEKVATLGFDSDVDHEEGELSVYITLDKMPDITSIAEMDIEINVDIDTTVLPFSIHSQFIEFVEAVSLVGGTLTPTADGTKLHWVSDGVNFITKEILEQYKYKIFLITFRSLSEEAKRMKFEYVEDGVQFVSSVPDETPVYNKTHHTVTTPVEVVPVKAVLGFEASQDETTGEVTLYVTLDKMPRVSAIANMTVDFDISPDVLSFVSAESLVGGTLSPSADGTSLAWYTTSGYIKNNVLNANGGRLFVIRYMPTVTEEKSVNFRYTASQIISAVSGETADYSTEQKYLTINEQEDKAVLGFSHEVDNTTGDITVYVTLDKMPDVTAISNMTVSYGINPDVLEFVSARSLVGGTLSPSADGTRLSWYTTSGYITDSVLSANGGRLFAITFRPVVTENTAATLNYTYSEIVSSVSGETADYTATENYTIRITTDESDKAVLGFDHEVDNATGDITVYVTLDKMPDVAAISNMTVRYGINPDVLEFVSARSLVGGTLSPSADGTSLAWFTTNGYITENVLEANGGKLFAITFRSVAQTATDALLGYTYTEIMPADISETADYTAVTDYEMSVPEGAVDKAVLGFDHEVDNTTGDITVYVTLDKMPDVAAISNMTVRYGINPDVLEFVSARSLVGGTLSPSADGTNLAWFTTNGYITENVLEANGGKLFAITFRSVAQEATDALLGYTYAEIIPADMSETADYTVVTDYEMSVPEGAVDKAVLGFSHITDEETGEITVYVTLDKLPEVSAISNMTVRYGIDPAVLEFVSARSLVGGTLSPSADGTRLAWFTTNGYITEEVLEANEGKLFAITFKSVAQTDTDVIINYTYSEIASSVLGETADYDVVRDYTLIAQEGAKAVLGFSHEVDGTTGEITVYVTLDKMPRVSAISNMTVRYGIDPAVLELVSAKSLVGGTLSASHDGTNLAWFTTSGYITEAVLEANEGKLFAITFKSTAQEDTDVLLNYIYSEIASSVLGERAAYETIKDYTFDVAQGEEDEVFNVSLYSGVSNKKHTYQIAKGEYITQAQIDEVLGAPDTYTAVSGYTDSDGNVHKIYPELWYMVKGEWTRFVPEKVAIEGDIDVHLLTRYISLEYNTDLTIKGVEIPTLLINVAYDSETDIGESILDTLTAVRTSLADALGVLDAKGKDPYDIIIGKLASFNLVDSEGNILNKEIAIPLHRFITEEFITGKIDSYIDNNIDNEDFIAKILSNPSVVDMLIGNDEIKLRVMNDPEKCEQLLTDDVIKNIIGKETVAGWIVTDQTFRDTFIASDDVFDFIIGDLETLVADSTYHDMIIDACVKFVIDVYFEKTITSEPLTNYIDSVLTSDEFIEDIEANPALRTMLAGEIKALIADLDSNPEAKADIYNEVRTSETFQTAIIEALINDETIMQPIRDDIKADLALGLADSQYASMVIDAVEDAFGDSESTLKATIMTKVQQAFTAGTLRDSVIKAIEEDFESENPVLKSKITEMIEDAFNSDEASALKTTILTSIQDETTEIGTKVKTYVKDNMADDIKASAKDAIEDSAKDWIADTSKLKTVIDDIREDVKSVLKSDRDIFTDALKRMEYSDDEIEDIANEYFSETGDEDIKDDINDEIDAFFDNEDNLAEIADMIDDNFNKVYDEVYEDIFDKLYGEEDIFNKAYASFIADGSKLEDAFKTYIDAGNLNDAVDMFVATDLDTAIDEFVALGGQNLEDAVAMYVESGDANLLTAINTYIGDSVNGDENLKAIFNEYKKDTANLIAPFKEYIKRDESLANPDANLDNAFGKFTSSGDSFDSFYETHFGENADPELFNEMFEVYYTTHVHDVADKAYDNIDLHDMIYDYVYTYTDELVGQYADGTLVDEHPDLVDTIDSLMHSEFPVRVRGMYYEEGSTIRTTVDSLIEKEGKALIKKYTEDGFTDEEADTKTFIADTIRDNIGIVVDKYVNGEIDPDVKIVIDAEIDGYMRTLIDNYVDGTDRDTLSDLIPEYAQDAIDTIKATDAFKNIISDFVSGKGVRVNKENEMFITILSDLLGEYDYDKIMAEFIPERVANLVELVGGEVVRKYVNLAFDDLLGGIDTALASIRADIENDINDTEYRFSTSPEIMVAYMQDFVVNYYNRLYDKVRSKLYSRLGGQIESNIYAKQLADTNWIELYLDRGEQDAIKSGYKLKANLMDYYDVTLKQMVLLHDAIRWYGSRSEISAEQRLDSASALIEAYANKANDMIMSFIEDGELPKGYSKYDIISKIERIFDLANDKVGALDKLESKEDTIASLIDRAYGIYDRYLNKNYEDIIDLKNVNIYADGNAYPVYKIILDMNEDDFDIDDLWAAIYDSDNYHDVSKIENAMAKIKNKIAQHKCEGTVHSPRFVVDAYRGTIDSRNIKGYATGSHTAEIQRYLQYIARRSSN